jgi:hypothetical protein
LPDARSGFAALSSDRIELRVCSAGWRRLDLGAVSLPFVEGSLLQFWSAAAEAEMVQSFGALSSD